MREKNKTKALLFFVVVLMILEIFLVHKYFFKNNAKLEEDQEKCEIATETKYIRGSSMEPPF